MKMAKSDSEQNAISSSSTSSNPGNKQPSSSTPTLPIRRILVEDDRIISSLDIAETERASLAVVIALDLVEEEVEHRPPLISVSARSSSFDSKDAVAPLEMAITFDFEEAEDSMASDRSAVEEEEEGLASSEAVCSLVLG